MNDLDARFGTKENETKRVYVSGPMSGKVGYNFAAFDEATARLVFEGYVVINPADKGIIPGWSWTDYLAHDIEQLVKECNAIYMLTGWQESRGARLEHHIARELEMEVMYE